MCRKVLVGAGILACVAAAGFLALRREAPAPGTDPSPFEPEAVEGPLVVAWIDGLDGDLVESLAETGSVDALLETMARGSVWPVRPTGTREPSEVFTTLATGMDAKIEKLSSSGEACRPNASCTPLAGVAPGAVGTDASGPSNT